MWTRRRQSPELFLSVYILIFLSIMLRKKIIYYDKETTRELSWRIAHVILINKTMRRLFPIF